MPHRSESSQAAANNAFDGRIKAPTATNVVDANRILMSVSQQGSHHQTSYYGASGSIASPARSIISHGTQPGSWSKDADTPDRHQVHRTLSTPKSTDSADRSEMSDRSPHRHDEESTVATLATEATHDEFDKREAGATALLLVHSQNIKPIASTTTSQDEDIPRDEASKVPFKKRKTHGDIIRRNSQIGNSASGSHEPYHVSPVSNASVGSSAMGRRVMSHEEPSPTAANNNMNSFHSETPEKSAGPKKNDTDATKSRVANEITPPYRQAPSVHFPSVLHKVLSDTDFSGSVLQWLPNGEAWKVLRWDALRREVLPRYFADLRDGDGVDCGTIDAFLWHLTAWGFEEVKDGTDVGAYRHHLFIRGAQKLCIKMRFNGTTTAIEQHHVTSVPNTVSPPRIINQCADRSILKVPTLASITRGDGEGNFCTPDGSKKRPRLDSQASSDVNISRQPSAFPGWSTVRSMESIIPGSYSAEEATYMDASTSWGHHYADTYRQTVPYGLHHSAYDPRMAYRPDVVMTQASPYTPPRIRSNRGSSMRLATASRISTVANAETTAAASAPTTAPHRSSFPVSNRGKSRSLCRTSIPTTTTMERQSPSLGSESGEMQRNKAGSPDIPRGPTPNSNVQ